MTRATKKTPVQLELSTRLLAVALTDAETLAAADELARCLQDIETEEGRAAQVKADLKSRVAALEAKRSSLALKVSRREEHRDIGVEKLLLAGEVYEVRVDTGEEIFRRLAREDELQGKLPGASL